MAARTTTKKKTPAKKKPLTRKTKAPAKKPVRRVIFVDLTNEDEDDELDLTPSPHVSAFLDGQCYHGVDRCSACTDNHRTDKLAVGLVAGGIGLLLGVAAAVAEPLQEEPSTIILLTTTGAA